MSDVRRLAAGFAVVSALAGCAAPRGPESGPAAGAAFVAALREAWDGEAAGLKTLSGTVRITVVPAEGKGASRALLAAVKYRAPADLRVALLADFVTLADASLTPGGGLLLLVPPLQRAYRASAAELAAVGAAAPELGFVASFGAEGVAHLLSGVSPLPAGEGRIVAEADSRHGADWRVSVKDASLADVRRLWVRRSDRAILRVEFVSGSKLTATAEASDFRRDDGRLRANRWIVTPADGGGRAVLHLQPMRRNERIDPKVFASEVPEGFTAGTLADLDADRKALESGGLPQ